MLKKNWSVGRRNFFFFFFFSFFFSRKERGRVFNIMKKNKKQKTSILLRVGAFLFYFAFLLVKNSSRVFETESVGLAKHSYS